MNRNSLIILILALWSILATSLVVYLYFRAEPVHIDNSFLEEQIKGLEEEKADLQIVIDDRNVEIMRRGIHIDSLLSLKPQITIEYVTIYKEIDNSSAITIVELSDSIYAVEGISH